MPKTLPIGTAKARFAECIRHAEAGRMVVLTRHGRPVASLNPIDDHGPIGMPGAATPGEVEESPGRYEAERAPGEHKATPPPAPESRRAALERLLQDSIWPRVPQEQLGVTIDKREREKVLGYGSDGV